MSLVVQGARVNGKRRKIMDTHSRLLDLQPIGEGIHPPRPLRCNGTDEPPDARYRALKKVRYAKEESWPQVIVRITARVPKYELYSS